MTVWVVAPGELDLPFYAAHRPNYKGWAKGQEDLYFPHVDSCCALIVFGNNYVVGGHMGQGLAKPHDDVFGVDAAGRFVWGQVAADHARLNMGSPLIMMIGTGDWYPGVAETIKKAFSPAGMVQYKTDNFAHGVEVWATMNSVEVADHDSKDLRTALAMPVAGQFPAPVQLRLN